MTRVEQQNGYILLPVVLLISLVATLAFMLNYESAQNAGNVGSLTEGKQSEYVAQAGLQHTLAQIAQAGCGPYTDISSDPFSNHSYSSTITTNKVGGAITTYTVAVSDDAFIREDLPTNNYGSDAKLEVYNKWFASEERRALYRFDIAASGIPAGTLVVSAIAKIFVVTPDPSTSVRLHQITADWTEGAVTWDNIAGDHDPNSVGSIANNPPIGQYVDVNITSLVQGWINGSVANQGIMLKPSFLNNNTLSEYTSKEYSNTSQRPVLEIAISDGSLSNRATVESTGTLANGVSRTLTRADITLYQSPPTNQVLQPGAASGKDAEIWDQNPNNNYGGAAETWVSSASNDTTRSLLHFNLGEIPAGARILEATLSLQRQSGSGADQPVSAHRIMNPWSEDSVTWNERESGTNWGTAGADFDTMAVATTPVGPVNQRYEWNITPLVQGWVDGNYPNYGVALTAAIAGMPGERFYTSDDSDPTRHPRLTITYSCECGVACTAPQGSGNILLVVGDDVTLDPGDTKKKAIFEVWGYNINLINDDADQATFDTALANNDVAYISETIWGPTLADKLAGTDKGVVNEEEDQNSHLGLSSSGSNIVNDSMEVIDNSHYITALFPNGVMPIFSAPMEAMLVTGTPAPGLQPLGNLSGIASLALVDNGGTLVGGGTAPGRRVAIPIGSNDKFNWDYLNNNGRLIVQRAIQWGTGNLGGFCADGNSRDEFTTTAFNNNDGSLPWNGDWIEVDASGLGTGTGKAQILSGEIRLQGTPSGDSPSLARELDLSSHLSATLSFDFRTGSGVETGEDGAVAEVSSDGGSNWTVLEDFINAGPSASGSRSYDISAHISTNTQVRFRIDVAYGGSNEYFYIDNVDIAASCDPPPPPTGPVAHWKLDDGAGTTAVDSEGGHHGNLTNGPTWTTGQVDGALDFDGSNDYVDLTSGAEIDDVFVGGATVMAWIYPTGWGGNGYGRIFDKSSSPSSTGDGWVIRMNVDNGGIINFGQGFTGGRGWWKIPNGSINLNTWQHITVVYDASSTTNDPLIYLDGSPLSVTTVDSPSGSVRSDASINLRLGNHAGGTAHTFDGKIDDARIYDRMLDPAEIAVIAGGSGGGGPPPSGSCDGTFRDEFNLEQYNQNDGTLSWVTNWEETGETTDPEADDIRIKNDVSDFQMMLRDDGQTVWREADLTGAASATLSFDYRRENLSGSGDYVAIEVSYNGGSSWTELDRFTGTADDVSYVSTSYELDAVSLSANTRIRFLTPNSGMDNNNKVWFDNVQILCSP